MNLGPFFMSTNLSRGRGRRRSGPSPLTKGAGKVFVWTLAFPFVAMYYICVWPFMKMFGVAADQYGATARGEAQPTWDDFRARHPRAALATIVLGGLFALALLVKLWFIWIPLVVIAGIAMLIGKRRLEHNERVQGLANRADQSMQPPWNGPTG